MDKDLQPTTLTVRKNDTADEAWFYKNKNTINVCIYKKGVGTLTITVPLSKLNN